MRRPVLLLIQIRDSEDPMAVHEVDCIRRRLGQRPILLEVSNALTQPASPWSA